MADNPTGQFIVSLKRITKRFGDKTVIEGLDLDVRNGEFLTLLGPSGCGKTTILRLLAGFESPDEGDIFIDGRRVNDLSPNQRHVNIVFQSFALFPHMTARNNVAFGLKMKKTDRAEIRDRVNEALRMVKLDDLADRKPHQLSGGQQQRVALARAVVNRPKVLLLDECLNALDYKLRKEMQIELKQIQRRLGITFIFVTHSQEEALSMSDRVIVMRDGQIEQAGTPRQVYETPANLFVARFVGEINIFDGIVTGRENRSTLLADVEGVGCTLRTPRAFEVGDRIKVMLRPEDMRVTELKNGMAADGSSIDGKFLGKVLERTYKGMTLDSLILLDSGKKIQASEFFDEEDPSFDYTIGERVAVGWVPTWEEILPDDGKEPV
jgi:spermidine/putrescine transport system ATP-binding protein